MAYTEEEIEQMKKELGITDNDNKSRTILTLDEIAAESNANKTQGKWIEYWNAKNRIFASMPQFYQQFKLITENLDANRQLLDSLRADFEKRWLFCSTRIIYNANNESARIIHNFGSNYQKEPIDLEIPVYINNNTIEEVLRQEKGRNFLGQLLQTEDSEDEIIQVFQTLSNKPRNKMNIWTPSQENRKSNPTRAVALSCNKGYFNIYWGNFLKISGRSRSVAASAESALKIN